MTRAETEAETEDDSPTACLRVDLHSHTHHSLDATSAPRELVDRAVEAGLDRIAVTDHGTLDGALEARELAPGLVIVGQEIRCRDRTELIGLFLRERVPEGRSFRETVERIRGQGGVVYAPHPFAYAWRAGWRAARLLAVADVVEAFNSRAFLPRWNRLARYAALRRSLPAAAGSDAHFPWEIGRAWTEMPPFRTATEFKEAVRSSRPVGLATGAAVLHVFSAGLKAFRWTADLAGVGRLGGLLVRPGTGQTTPASAFGDGDGRLATPPPGRGGPAIG